MSQSLGAVARRLNPFELSLPQTALQLVYSAPLWIVTPNRRYLDPEEFEDTRALRDHATALVEELQGFIDERSSPPIQQIDPSQRRLNRDTRWTFFPLRIYGRDFRAHRAELPVTSAFLDAHPEFVTASISTLAPGKRLPPHPGPMKGVLRVHLAVEVPSRGRCEMIVGGEHRSWERRAVMVFDDTYLHRAVNDTDEFRSVLFLDLVRPLPRPWMDRLNRRMIAWLGRRRRIDVIDALAEQREGGEPVPDPAGGR